MSTAIQWTHIPGYASDVWNPTTGCTSNGTGCDLCYARTLTNMRHKAYKAGKLQKMPHYAHPFSVVQRHPGRLANPLKVKRPTCYFVNSMSDLFHEEVPFSFIDQVFAVMAMCPQHIFIILTKRPERMAEYTAGARELAKGEPQMSPMTQMNAAAVMRGRLTKAAGNACGEALVRFDEDGAKAHLNAWNRRREDWSTWPLSNVWMGASASTQAEVDAAVPHVLRTKAAKRILSLEPLVERVTLEKRWGKRCSYCGNDDGETGRCFCGMTTTAGIDWIIVGGESGTTKQKPRPMHPDWPRQVRDECKAAGGSFFFKQWGTWLPSYDAGERAHETANYGKTFGERWAANATSMRFPDGIGMVRAGKTANGNLLDGKQEYSWPIQAAAADGRRMDVTAEVRC